MLREGVALAGVLAAICLQVDAGRAQTLATLQGPQPVPARVTSAEDKPAADMQETVAWVPVSLKLPDGSNHHGDMVVTHFRPKGDGPFPALIFSHGRTPSARHEPVRWRAISTARYWTRRGFAVLVPTRIGYGEHARIVDPEASGACDTADFRPAVRAMTTQIARTVEFAHTLPWVDPGRIVLSGVSYGGFATIAATAEPMPGVVGAINFVGGLGGMPQLRPGRPCQAAQSGAIMAAAGATSSVETLWLYADNDAYWGSHWPRRWHEAFTSAGGRSRLKTFPAVGDDGHRLMSRGFRLWRPEVDRFVKHLGFTLPEAVPALAASSYAAIEDAGKLPHVKPAVRADAYAKFLAADVPRAFAIAPNGAWAWRSGPDAAELAIDLCRTHARGQCRLYAVDDRVVWKPAAR